MKSLYRYLYVHWLQLKQSGWIFNTELRRVFHDGGVLIIFFLATLAYPFLYKCMYWNEQITDIPVAVVDLSNSTESRDFIHKWSAAPEVKLTHFCTSMEEAEILLRDQKVHGIIYFPRDYAKQLADPLGQAHISLYCDMSSFLYMKGIYLSCNMVMLESMQRVQIDRYEKMGYGEEFAWELVQEAPYTETILFAPTGGYGSFLVPAVLVMILHQTLFFGICMIAGTIREEKSELYRIPGRRRGYSAFRTIIGRGAAYFVIYYVLAAILLGVFPRLFDLPHVGNIWDILRFNVPFILSVIFMSMCVGFFIRNREAGMVLLISTSLIFLFIAGISWPKEMVPTGWKFVAAFIPYTWAANGFIHINSMGASLWDVRTEYIALWIQAAGYFTLAVAMFMVAGYRRELQESRRDELSEADRLSEAFGTTFQHEG